MDNQIAAKISACIEYSQAYGSDDMLITAKLAESELEDLIKGRHFGPGVSAIQVEQLHQRAKGYTLAHDRNWTGNQLVLAALCYLAINSTFSIRRWIKLWWPFEERYFRPEGRIVNLSKAGALIASEIDRLQAEIDDADVFRIVDSSNKP